ncbi:MAG: hypothetical protein K0B01_10585 [Syntrophobacterales bacterium]|nr:hypothetical protein [Syntrophobacterales bacterium]
MFLFVQQWEIIKGKEDDYSTFILRKHLPAMAKVGLNIIGGFHVILGSGPRITSAAMADDFLSMQMAWQREEFIEVTKELNNYVANYSNAVLKDTGRVDMANYGLALGTWRFNQYFKLVRGTEAAYTDFLKNEYLPMLAKVGIRVQAEWQVIIGNTLRLILEGLTTNLVEVAQAMMTDEYRRLRRRLLANFAKDYSSRILAPTGRVEMAYLLSGITKSL